MLARARTVPLAATALRSAIRPAVAGPPCVRALHSTATAASSRSGGQARSPNSYYSWHSIELATTKSLDVPPIAEPKRTHNQLVCNLELSGFMPDHLDFVAYFARHAAKALKMPTSDTIHLKTAINRWFTNKGPFVHAKTKEIFERKTYHRLIQAFDASPETITAWVKYVNESLPPGVDLKVERFEWEPLGFGKALPEPKIEGQKTHVEEVRERAAQYLAQFTKK